MATFTGTPGSDIIIGSSGDDTILGLGGDDTLSGGDGNDTIDGGPGNDTITGGPGIDTLTGGTGADTFLDTAAGLNGDTITDFSPGDRIQITDLPLASANIHLVGNMIDFGSGATAGSITIGNGISGGRYVLRALGTTGVEIRFQQDAHNDFNGDGRSDVLWRSDDGSLSDWLGTANGGFVNNDVHAASFAPTSWSEVGTGDFNGDGRVDLLWRNTSTGALSDWLANSNGGFANNDANAASFAPTSWHVVGTGDFNGDGKADILWRNDSGAISDWLGTSSGGFTNNDTNAAGFAPTSWTVAGTGDFNGDGIDDILWRNTSTGALSDWLGNANGGFTNNDANAAGWAPTNWSIAAVGDFNGDGRADILWRSDTGAISDWLGTSSGGFTNNDANAAGWAPTSWHIAAIGDFNGDATDDILWRSDTGAISDWLGTTNGGFTNNDANAAGFAPTTWHVQDPFL